MTDQVSEVIEGDKSEFKALLDEVEQSGHDIAAKFLDEVENKLLKIPMNKINEFSTSNTYVQKFKKLLLATEKQGAEVLHGFRLGIRRHLFYAHEKVEREEARRREVHVVVAGLFGAGKTSLLYDTVLDMKLPTSPTSAEHHNVEKFQYRDKDFVISDLAEQALSSKRRSVWETHHSKGVHLVLFVMDATDKSKFPAAKELLLNQIATSERLKGQPIVICANKSDQKEATSVAELTEILELKNLPNKLSVIPTHVLDNHTSSKALIHILEALAGNKYHEIYQLICDYACPPTAFHIAFDWYLDMLEAQERKS